MKLKQLFIIITIATAFITFFGNSAYAIEPVYKNTAGLAIKGFDPVAYFLLGKPTEGKSKFTFMWKDAEWHFSNEKHLSLFKENPEKYAPQFGGYCAFAVSQGYTAGIDPNAWTIVKDKLYLNYSLSVRKKWLKNVPDNIMKAEANWPKLLSKIKKLACYKALQRTAKSPQLSLIIGHIEETHRKKMLLEFRRIWGILKILSGKKYRGSPCFV